MLVLAPEAACDICADPYGNECLPHSIPCGHTFCAACLRKITKGTLAPRAACGCPLCRESFTDTDIRRIRIDAAPSNSPPYPRVMPYPNYYPVAAPSKVAAHPGWSKVIDEDALEASGEDRRVKAEARRLEQRVADTASRQSSFEEISSLHREVQQWLDKQSARKSNSEHAALRLSATLLGTMLVNRFAYDEVKRSDKGAEVGLKDKLEAVESAKRRLELEVHRQRTEVYALKQEMAKLTGAQPPQLPPLVPTPSTTGTARPLGSSLSSASIPSPTSANRSQTPGPAPSARSHTPVPARSQTPGAALGMGMSTSAYNAYHNHTSPHRSGASSTTTSPPRSTATSPERPSTASSAASSMSAASAAAYSHQRWLPSMSREPDEVPGRPGTAFAPAQQQSHARAYSLGASLGRSTARPQTAAGWKA